MMRMTARALAKTNTKTRNKHVCKFRDCGNGWYLCFKCKNFKWGKVIKARKEIEV